MVKLNVICVVFLCFLDLCIVQSQLLNSLDKEFILKDDRYQITGNDASRDARTSVVSISSLSNHNSRLKCGRSSDFRGARITDGKVASIAEFPWMVSLQREYKFWFGFKTYQHSCGASLLTPSWLITASHCFYDKEGPVRAVAGVDNMSFMYRAQVRTVVRIINHPGFDITDYNNDITLVKVDHPFNLDSGFSHVGAICLEPDLPVLTYDIATVCGFGSKAYHQRSSTRLYQTEIAIVDQNVCNDSFSGSISENMICAGGMIAGKRDACAGDSGGPLMLELESHYALIGLVSFGTKCATEGVPGVYTRVGNYYGWILENIDEPLIDA